MVVCSKKMHRLPKQYCVSLCLVFLFVHLLSFLPVFVILSCICLHHTCLTEHLSLSLALLCMDIFRLSLFFSFHDALALKKGISPLRNCLPLSPLLQKHSGRGRVSIFPSLIMCVPYVCVSHSLLKLFLFYISLHREH